MGYDHLPYFPHYLRPHYPPADGAQLPCDNASGFSGESTSERGEEEEGSKYSDISDPEGDDGAANPFQTMPALRNFHLTGARVALNTSRNFRQPPEEAIALWDNARGF